MSFANTKNFGLAILHLYSRHIQFLKIVDFVRKCNTLKNASFLEMTRWATINNAYALGLADRIGSLAPGKQADIITIRTSDLNTMLANNPREIAVLHSYPSNMATVFVAGQKVKEAGRLLFAPDELAELKQKLMDSNHRTMREAGLVE
jgi:cytosine/adenosine deaminase-related metal-dependent hydrolase